MELLTKSFYTSHLRAIRELIEEPAGAPPKHGEPVLEVLVATAEFWQGTYAEPELQKMFVRLWMDGELVGETSVHDLAVQGPQPTWNQRFLVLPRGSWCSRFEVCAGVGRPQVRGYCAYGTEGLWRAANSCGHSLSIDAPLLSAEGEVGVLEVHFRMWDGLPVQETPWWPGQPVPPADAGDGAVGASGVTAASGASAASQATRSTWQMDPVAVGRPSGAPSGPLLGGFAAASAAGHLSAPAPGAAWGAGAGAAAGAFHRAVV